MARCYQEDDDNVVLADILSMKISKESKRSSKASSQKKNDWLFQNDMQQQQQLQASFYQLHYLHQQQMKTMMRQGTNSNRSSISYPISPSSSTSSLHSKSSSLGRKIKQVFGKAKNTERGPKEIIMPDSPNSSVSSRKSRYFRNSIALPPSPASSTISSKVSFSSAITLHETYSASEYDRTGDNNVTCQFLTPDMAVKIKEELNSYKLNDMPVHPQSRQFTHFFV